MIGKELVGPLRTITFQSGSRHSVRQAYDTPRDTMDRRYRLCTDHHPACDCREAELAEQLGEYRAEETQMRRAAARLLVGHRVHDYGDDCCQFAQGLSREEVGEETWWRYISGDGPLACQCTGCQIVRAGHLRVWTDDHGVITTDAESRVR
jgi:hypothetical protein